LEKGESVDFAPRHGRTGETGPSSIKWTSKYGSVVATGYDSNVSVPYGLNTPEEPNISSTCWRTVVDHKRRLYLFESALTPNTLWVDLKAIDLSPASGNVLKLDLGPNQDDTCSCDATKEFKEAKPRFLGVHEERFKQWRDN
jgi:penicillin V acylase-like amidase (Ntn superfamily)